MSNYKTLSVRSLRELAREHLGRNHSRLKTREELVAALREKVPEVMARLLGPAPSPASEVAPSARDEGGSSPKSAQARKAETPRKEAPPAASATAVPEPPAPAEPVRAQRPPAPKPERAGEASRATAEPVSAPLTEGFFQAPPRRAEPLIEGFFVARMAGERELLRHHLVEAEVPFHDAVSTLNFRGEESLGELPVAYDDDHVVLLARDPRTLYFFWNVGPSLARVAGAGRLRVRIFEGEVAVREDALELNARGFYLHDLAPGRVYRIECYVHGDGGRVSSLRAVSNAVQLPAEGPSDELDVEVMRVPWNAPIAPTEPRRETPAGAWIDTPDHPLASSHEVPQRAAPPDWTKGPHLELPSSHSWRGGSGRR